MCPADHVCVLTVYPRERLLGCFLVVQSLPEVLRFQQTGCPQQADEGMMMFNTRLAGHPVSK